MLIVAMDCGKEFSWFEGGVKWLLVRLGALEDSSFSEVHAVSAATLTITSRGRRSRFE